MCCKAKLFRSGAEAKASVNSATRVARSRPETVVIYPWPGGSELNRLWTPERTSVEKLGDELWIGVKG